MLRNPTAALILVSIAGRVMAAGYSQPVVMTGVTQMADTVELRFDPATKNSGTLVILGDHTNTAAQSFPFVYSVPEPQQGEVHPLVNLGCMRIVQVRCRLCGVPWDGKG